MEARDIAKVGHYYYQIPGTPGRIHWEWHDVWGWMPSSGIRPWPRIPTPSTEQVDKAVELWPPNEPKAVITKASP